MGTHFLAMVMGWYLVIMSLLLLFRHDHIKAVVMDVVANKSVFFLLSVISLIIGLLLVFTHSQWVMAWPVIVTVLSWVILISAIFRLFFPQLAIKVARKLLKSKTYLSSQGLLLLLVGAYLLYRAY